MDTSLRKWLVIGETGEYSDRRQWEAGIFDTQAEAEAWADAANAIMVRFGLHKNTGSVATAELRHLIQAFDPNWQVSYPGVQYHFGEVRVSPPLPVVEEDPT